MCQAGSAMSQTGDAGGVAARGGVRADVWHVLGLSLACASLALAGVWLNVSGRGGVLVAFYSSEGRSLFYGCRLISLLVLIILHRPIYRHAPQASVFAGALMAVGTVVRVVASQLQGALMEEMTLVGYALSGLGYLPCLILLYFGLARVFELKAALTVTLLAMVVKEQLPALLAGLPEELAIWVLMAILVLLMGSLVAFWGVCRRISPGGLGRGVTRAAPAYQGRDLWYVVVLGGISSLSVYFFNSVSQVGLAGGAALSSATSGAILSAPGKVMALAICVGLGYFTVIRRADRPLMGRFVPAFVAIALGTASATAAAMIGGALSVDVVQICLLGVYDFNQYLSWALLVCVARKGYAPAIRGFTALLALHEVLATFVGPLPVDVFSANGSTLTIISGLLITVFAAVVIPFAMMRRASWIPAGAGTSDAGGTGVARLEPRLQSEVDELGQETVRRLRNAMDERCAYVSRQLGLTAREGEVFGLLCQGLSRAAICEELCLSEGTVKTHIAHIYEKTGVNTREALTDFVFGR